ncbi:MAG: tyrosine-type recombinase/integrase [Cyclobacteriaceae bacterium]
MKTIRVNFFLDTSRSNSEGLSPIRVRSKHNSDKLIIRSTGHFCEASEWNKKKSVPKDTHTFNLVTALEAKIKTEYDELAKDDPTVNLSDVWNKLFPSDGYHGNIPRSKKIVDWVDYYLKHSPNSKDYARGVKLLRVHLAGQTKKGKIKAFNPNLKFQEINQTTVNALCTHMAKQGKSTGTIIKTVKFLKQISRMAADHNVKIGSLEFKPPRNFLNKARTEIRLSLLEIHKIRDVETLKSTHGVIKDIFLAQCFTGMRFSDVMRLTPENFKSDFIEFKQQKTGDLVLTTLHQYSKPIFRKYLKDKKPSDFIFPQYKQQIVNREIKNIARAAGLKEKVKVTVYQGAERVEDEIQKYKMVSSHTGRRSFSRILSMVGLSEKIIAEEMGHKVLSITDHYIGGTEHRERIKIVQKAWEKAEQLKDVHLMVA